MPKHDPHDDFAVDTEDFEEDDDEQEPEDDEEEEGDFTGSGESDFGRVRRCQRCGHVASRAASAKPRATRKRTRRGAKRTLVSRGRSKRKSAPRRSRSRKNAPRRSRSRKTARRRSRRAR